MIQQYNCAMGGTDRMDQNIEAYRISIRQKKYWWCIFCWLLGGSDAERLDHLPPTSSRRDSDQLHQIHRPVSPGRDNEATVGTSKYRIYSASCSSEHLLR